MELDAGKFACLVALALLMFAITVAAVRGGSGARQAIREWATSAGLTEVWLRGTSLQPHPQMGTAKTGNATFRITAVKPNGQLVSGSVKCNTFCRRRNMAATVEAKFTRMSIAPSGFPVRLLADRAADAERQVPPSDDTTGAT